MNTTAAYTPLESLLLFQSLVEFGTEDQDFNRISDLLTNNSLVKEGESYDTQRLTSDALRQLYLQLLREELAGEGDPSQDGNTSKKRKLASPPLPSVKDAQECREKLPQLVDRLYARYRDHMVKAIREDEERYASIQKEIGEIERGEWDERIIQEDRAKTNGSAPVEAPIIGTNGSLEKPVPEERRIGSSEPTKATLPEQQSPLPSPRPDGLAITDVLNNQDATPSHPKGPDQGRNVLHHPQNPQQFPQNHQRNGSTGPHGPSPLQPLPPQPQQPLRWEHSYAQPQPQQHSQQHPFQPPQSYPPYPQYPPPYPQQARGSFPSPHGLPPPHAHVPSSPINAPHMHLPHPNSSRQPPGSPGMHLDTLADIAGQQYRAPSGSPVIQQGPPPPAGYPQSYPQQQRPPSSNGPPQWNGQQFQPGYHQQYPQYATPQRATPFQPPANLIQSEARPYSSPYNANQGPRQSQSTSVPRPFPNLPHTPISHPHPLSACITGSGTKWTPTAAGTSTPRSYRQIDSPAIEPLSPVQRPAELPQPKKTPKKKTSPEKPIQKPEPSAAKPTKTPRRGVQRTRAGSTASSVIAGSNRSQSVMSHADDLSMDTEHVNRLVKQEVNTPLAMGVEDTGDTTADELPRLPRSGISPHHSNKRKRASSIPTPIGSQTPSAPPTHVVWTRAFPKISASALDSIASHKNAGLFAAAVTERMAPGYTKEIFRPQDLKSIRSAIAAGHRAASNVMPEDTDPSATTVWLPISEDLIPPKGIINYAQLEKELMRMFANAIMFNLDPNRGLGRKHGHLGKGKDATVGGYEVDENSIVKETRAMFCTVERTISELRSAERRSEEIRESSMARGNPEDEEMDELAADGESHYGGSSTAKRRRKA